MLHAFAVLSKTTCNYNIDLMIPAADATYIKYPSLNNLQSSLIVGLWQRQVKIALSPAAGCHFVSL